MEIRRKLIRENNSGIILIVVLWILVILTMLAVGLGHRTGMELSLTKYAVGKVKAKYLVWAGLMYAMEQIRSDTQDEETSQFDTLYENAVNLKGKAPEEVFKNINVGSGHFDISYPPSKVSSVFETQDQYYGLRNEEEKININALTAQNYKTLSNLITLLGYDDESADEIAASAVDWRDDDDTIAVPEKGAEDSYYMGLSQQYHCKNRPFDSVEELLLVKGMTQEIFDGIKEYITVYPKEGNLLVNFDTASETVVKALARSVTGPQTNTDISDADSMTDKLISYRWGDDQQEFTEDDRVIDSNELGLNSKEEAIFRTIEAYRTKVSQFPRIVIQGVDNASEVQTSVEAVVRRDDLTIVYWNRN